MRYADALAAPPVRVPQSLARGLRTTWGETGLIVAAAAIILLAMAQPAFGYFFFGEDFLYLGQFRAHGNDFWAGVLSPTDNIFFRPVFCAVNLLWNMVLPLDPWVHHVRNFVFAVLNLVLLYRILVRLVASVRARLIALLFFALSKAHLVAIGYINVYDSIVSLMLLLLTVLFWLRYAAQRRWYDYAAGLVFSFLAVFTKDYGLVVVGVVFALVGFVATSPAARRREACWWALRFAPLPLIVLLYLGVRWQIVGPPPISGQGAVDSAYAMALNPALVGFKTLIFTSTMANLSFGDPGTTGAGGLGYAAERQAVAPGVDWSWLDKGLYAGFMALAAVTLAAGYRGGWPLLFPLCWIAAYFGPTFLTRNIQIYYMYEPLAGAAVLLGMCLTRATPRLLGAWALALCVITLNGMVNNYSSLYHWEFVANGALRANHAIVEPNRGRPLDSVTLVTSQQGFWLYTLLGDRKGLALPELLGRPDLMVQIVGPDELSSRVAVADEHNLVFDADDNFFAYPTAPLQLERVVPSGTQAGVAFGVQPDGSAALSVQAQSAQPGTQIVWDDVGLPTSYGSATLLSATVPPELFAVPGRHEIYLRRGPLVSNRQEFNVEP